MIYNCFLLLLFLASSSIQDAFSQTACKGTGKIQGTVLDRDGKPVRNATVSVLHEQCAMNGIQPSSVTDEKGLFFLDRIPAGLTGVYAKKEESGYPDTRYAINKDDTVEIPKVMVRAGEVARDVVVQLGKPAVFVHVEVTDVDTSEPVLQARITVSKLANSEIMFSTSADKEGNFRLLLPQGRIRFQLVAPRYHEWHLPSVGSSQDVLEVRPGPSMELKIRLKKLPEPQLPKKEQRE
jgi:hypothetical protein